MKIILYLLLLSCLACRGKEQLYTRLICDALGRNVLLPDTIKRVVCLRSSAIRMVTYAGGSDFICGVEESETQENHEYTHLFAHPELLRKPIVGPRMGGDAELLMLARPDVIFMASTTIGEANELQSRIGIPVIALEYGDMGRKRSVFCYSLQLIGEVLHTQKQVDTLICFINRQLDDLQNRVEGLVQVEDVYVGGISYRGQKGLTSTDPYYAALELLDIYNVASELDTSVVSAIAGTYIDWEQLIEWNPDLIFVDVSGWPLVEQEFKTYAKLNQLLQAYATKQIYLLWPYNNYHSNFDVMLVNAWYVGKVLFPEHFEDISMKQKINEIMFYFVGDTIANQLITCWGKHQNVFDRLKNNE